MFPWLFVIPIDLHRCLHIWTCYDSESNGAGCQVQEWVVAPGPSVIEHDRTQSLAQNHCCGPLLHLPPLCALLPSNGYHGTISGPVQPLDCTEVGPAHKQLTVKKGQLMRGFRQQWSGDPEVESEVRGGPCTSPWGPPVHPDLGSWVSWRTQRTGLGLCPTGLQSLQRGYPLTLAQALRQWWTSSLSWSLWCNNSQSLPGL